MKEVIYKCNHAIDPSTKEFRKKCTMCAINLYLVEQGKKYVTVRDEDEIKEFICPHANEPLEVSKVTTQSIAPIVLVKMTVDQVKRDRKQRSSEHFQKQILPTLGKDEQRHHRNKKND